MSQLDLPVSQQLDIAFRALREDVLHPGGPRISSIRDYRFAILPYPPELEHDLRRRVQTLARDLRQAGWHVESISLIELLLARLDAKGLTDRLIQAEALLGNRRMDRGLGYLGESITKQLQGTDGLAADCARRIEERRQRLPDDEQDRLLCLIGGAGPLYPFFRYSALLRYLDGHTHGVPVVLLYPGHQHGNTGLSFMGQLKPDGDYRPRIYP
ncbi:MAG: DUF1788 domain-containing protein [Myxococcales bacterium]|nr:DUF1788 domain-containing protein [Myxococcales bacterium]